MAKKKGKKNTQKQVDVTSAPASPKPTPVSAVEETAPEVTEPLELTSEAPEVDALPDEQPESTTEAAEAKIDEAVDGPTPELTTEEATEPEAPSSEEQELVETSSSKDEAATDPITDTATEADPTPVEAAVDDATTANESEEAVTEATPELTEPIEEVADDVAEPVEETPAAAEAEAVSEPVAEDETEATSATVEEPSVLAPEALEEAEQSVVAEQEDAPAPEVTPDAVDSHSDPVEATTTEPAPIAEEIAEESPEEPQPVDTVAEAPEEAAAPEETEAAVAESSDPPAEDDWASAPKSIKKNKKDKKKKKKQAAAAESVSVVAEAAPDQEVPTVESVAEQPVEEPTVEPTAEPQESEPEAADPLPIAEDKAVPEAAVEPESIAQEPVVEPPAAVEPAVVETARAPAPRPEPEPEPPAAPAAAAHPGLSSAENDTCQPIPAASKQSPRSPHTVVRAMTKSRAPEAPRLREAPAPPKAVRQVVDDRPPAPSPPVERARTRHVPAFDDDDDSDSALVHSRRRDRGGEALVSSRDSSGSRYPPHAAPAHHARASGFASRVPAEHYPNPPPPPGYHPRYGYAPGAPPYYPNQHGYGMSQPGYSNANPYGPSSHNSSSPYQETWNQYPPGYPPNGTSHQHHDTSASRDYGMGMPAIENGSLFDGETADIFSRISQAIPDLHASLARQKEVHGQLSQKLRAKDEEIYDLKERIIHIENKHSAEAKEQVKELREQIAETHKHKREAEDTKLAWEASTKTWETKVKELEAMYASEKAQAKKEFDEWKAAATTRHDAEKIALAIQYDKKLKEADLLAETRRQEEVDALAAEQEELRAEHERQQQEREAIFTSERDELETKLGDAQREHEEAREHWLAEREALIRSHQEHSDSLQSGWSEEREALDAKYQEAKEESDRAWAELHSEANRRADELAREKDDLLRKYDELKAESQKEKEIIKSVAANLESEKSRLEKMMECYGDIAEIKSKGDTYYLVSFSQLQKQIIDLAATHFKHLPVRPPHEELAQVPHNLPSFLGDTPASRQVRAAYIAHTVSKLITYRVFGPFLFSLGRRYDKADSLFLSMSHHIRDKSTRKEAIWRQQTLLAAFTSSGAKQRINTAAGTVVEEIVNAIKHFADPREEEGIKIAVKRIVKLAAETWRFARLEREMITATMPALYDEEHQFTGPDFWPAYESAHKPDGTLIGSLADTTHPSDGQPTLLLRLFPVIYREPKHENFHANGERNDEGCIYHHGMALYDDAEPVITRAEELKSAGLPSFTTASPTNAEFGKFPPPMVPPPRNPLPPTPAMSEKTTSVRTKSPPPSPHEGSDRSPRRRRTPPPPPSSIAALNEAMTLPVRAYQRPPPGPIDFATPRNIIGMPPPVESIFTQAPSKASKTPPESVFTETGRLLAESASIPEAVEEEEEEEELPEPTPADSETLPVFLEHEPPTPPRSPHSRASTPERPASPLFEVIDEIESLQSHRIQPSLRRRRSTRTRHVEDELPDITPRQETLRRTSGYALSNRTLRTERSERTERSGKSERTERTEKPDLKTRYMCESRSAGVKALYPNSPMSMQNGKAFKEAMQAKRASKDSMRSDSHQKWLKEQGKKSPEKVGRSERSERSERPDRSDRGSRELRREKSTKSVKSVAETVPDNGTWDTNSTLSSLETNTQFSVNEH